MKPAPDRMTELEGVLPVRQQRSLARREALLDAGLTLLATREFDDLTIGEIVAHAGCSVGGFYTRFVDKEIYFKALQVRVMDDMVADARRRLAEERWRDAPLEAVVRGVVGFVYDHFRGRLGAVVRGTVRRAFADADAWQAISVGRDLLATRSQALIAAHVPAGHPVPTTYQIRFCMQIIGGTFTNAMLNNPGPVAFDDDRLPEMLTDVWMRYLELDRG